jgi:Domain of unknown function (DUF4352)
MQQDPQQPNMQGNIPPQGYPQPQAYPQPQPGYPQPHQQSKKRNPLLIIAGIVGALVLVCCLGVVAFAALGN